ncbi:phosphoadenosine phosphosulfate reductase [Kitasatospora sp. NPDC085879]|uniref:phosphoadenosine phosphosulfate reductase n=1 Tax=Kitasatospora sp. NPDC085879 TaxID=3154769 RepID=UPI003434D759
MLPVPSTIAPPTNALRSFSFGGGVQSMAALVLAARGDLDYRTFLFAHVGEDSENPATLTYLDRYAKPFAQAHGIELTTLHRVMVRSKETRTLYSEITREGSKALKIPVRFKNGAPGKRACTHDYKIQSIARELKRRGATEQAPARVGIGISLDEIHRANERKAEKHERIDYPLLRLGLRRIDCARVIREAGLPVPPKSSCWFCPFKRPETWHEMRRTEPELFERACQLEDYLNVRQAGLGKNAVYLTQFGRPLRQAIPDGVDPLFDLDDDADGLCDSGHCMT